MSNDTNISEVTNNNPIDDPNDSDMNPTQKKDEFGPEEQKETKTLSGAAQIKKDEQDTTTIKLHGRKDKKVSRATDGDGTASDQNQTKEQTLEVGHNAAKKRQRQELTKGKSQEEIRSGFANDLKSVKQYKDSLAKEKGVKVKEYNDGF